MGFLNNNTGLYTDHYELTMAQGYYFSGKGTIPAGFDYFFRKNPFGGGYTIFAGLADLFEGIGNFRFGEEDCRFLESSGFDRDFIEFLKDFRFNGDIYAVPEGEIIFPNEPVVRVEGNLIECQLIESILLNILNFQSLIATKASRMRLVSGDRSLFEFGLRRAQGLGAIHASRAAIIGGFNSTSNLFSALQFGIRSGGTMAHSWIQSYDNELNAFRAYVEQYPDSAILLVDTYNTLKSGLPNAIKIAKELEVKGKKLAGIRLDSGDLAYLSKACRKLLDDAQLQYVKIIVSNQIDECVIKSLLLQQAPIDAFGIGTALVTGDDDGALDGVYKMAQINNRATMKVSENITKTTLPGKKEIYRYLDEHNLFYADGIELSNEEFPPVIYHPHDPSKHTEVKNLKRERILKPAMHNGKKVADQPSIDEIAHLASDRLKQLPEEMKRFENPHIYKVGIGDGLRTLRDNLKHEIWMPY